MNILEKIVAEKRKIVAEKKAAFPLENFRERVKKSDRDFYAAMNSQRPAFILECKKASPSKGLIRPNFVPEEIADVYKNYATAVSVLCDEPFFQGKFENIARVRERISQPVLAKEFFIDEYQIFLVRFFGADAILLMLSVLSESEYLKFAGTAHALGMGVLTEVSTPKEAEIANRVGAKIVGINNRNLRDLSTNLSRTHEMAALVRQPGRIVVAESGISSHAEILETLEFADAFLVGTSLMRESDLESACRKLLLGENKVCGLTNVPDARAAFASGAIFGGLIFAENSPRKISAGTANEIVQSVPELKFVGVFQNQSADFVAEISKNLGLFAVQLHGNETADFAAELRKKLPSGTQIWKAISDKNLENLGNAEFEKIFENAAGTPNFVRFAFDYGNGGSGNVFDWYKYPEKLRSSSLLAGGISPENARNAHKIGCLGLDLNSGAEDFPGKKSAEKLAKIFAEIRKF